MNAKRIISTIIVLFSMAFVSACSEVSLEGHEDIVSVIEKLPECYDNPDIAMEIYTDDAILMPKDPRSGLIGKLTGPKEIGYYQKEIGKGFVVRKLSINSIKRETDKAHVEYIFYRNTIEGRPYEVPLCGNVELVKKGQTWKIKKDRVEY